MSCAGWDIVTVPAECYVLFEMFIFSVLLLKKWQRCVLFFLYMTKIDLFSLSIFILFVLFCIPFFSIRDQIINFHAAF